MLPSSDSSLQIMHDPSLTSKQRTHLRALAHGMKPVLQVGNDGVGDAFLHSRTEKDEGVGQRSRERAALLPP